MSELPPRRRRIGFGEIIGLSAVIISGLGVWISWKNITDNGPTRVVEQRQAIALTLRATVDRDGRTLTIAPVESSHALESLRLTIPGVKAVPVASNGELDARDVEDALKLADGERKGNHAVPVTIDARYVEAGADRRRSATYILRYRWEGGGLFGGRSLRLTGLSRA